MKLSVAKRVVLVVGLAIVIGVGVRAVRDGSATTVEGQRSDFTVYYAAGRAVIEGTNIYEAHNLRGMLPSTLPIFAVAMVPLAMLSAWWGALLWYGLTVLTLAHAVHLSVKLARRCFPAWQVDSFWLHVGLTALVLPQLMTGASRQNPSTLVTWLVILAVWLFFERKNWLAALCVAISIVVKMFPGLLLVYFLAKRRWKMAGATLVWLGVLMWALPSLVFGVRGNDALLRQWLNMITLPRMSLEGTKTAPATSGKFRPSQTSNQALQAVVVKLVTGKAAAGRDARGKVAQALAAAACFVVVGMSVWACRRGTAEPGSRRTLCELCVVICLMLLLSPVSWFHQFALLLLPLAVMLALRAHGAVAAYVSASVLMQVSHALLTFGVFLGGVLAVWWTLVNAAECAASKTDSGLVPPSAAASNGDTSTAKTPDARG